MDADKLRKILQQREGPKLDYKLSMALASETHKKELAKDVIAIANTPGGRGYIIIGVRDKTRTLEGVNPDHYPEETIQQIVQNRCDPPIPISVDAIVLEKTSLVVITIFKSNARPHQMRQTGAFYIRRGSTTDFAHRDEIAVMMSNAGIVLAEAMPVRQATLSAYNQDQLVAYIALKTGEPNRSTDSNLLYLLGLVYRDLEENRDYPTTGGILLLAQRPQQYLPHTGVKCIVSLSPGQREVNYFEGSLLTLLELVMEFLKPICIQARYPIELFEEALCNALVHRDYYEHRREISIFISGRRVEIANPGSISDAENVQHLLQHATTKRRNPWLYQQLLDLDTQGRFKRYGLGITKMKQLLMNHGGLRVVNMKRANVFKLILPGLDHFSKYQKN